MFRGPTIRLTTSENQFSKQQRVHQKKFSTKVEVLHNIKDFFPVKILNLMPVSDLGQLRPVFTSQNASFEVSKN